MKNNCIYKYQLAEKIGIHSRTLTTWLNVRYFAELEKLGYRKTQKYLMPCQLAFLSQKLGLEL